MAKLAVFTSGSDAPGMNAALRAVVRVGLNKGFRLLLVHDGYRGLVEGGAYFQEAHWSTVSNIMQLSGTVIGSSTCDEFQLTEGRLRALENLVHHGVTDLICIGGNDSLRALYLFHQEWPSLMQQLCLLREAAVDRRPPVRMVAIPCSIYNDFCGTDITIGVDSALNRIIESIDAVATTAQSHKRSFVIEVMGNWCGYLALTAAIASEADWIFIREWPVPENWPQLLSRKLEESRVYGKRVSIIVCSKGAVDTSDTPVTSEQVRRVMQDVLGYDTRVTVLGHVQRGGTPSAFDRLLACRMGADAVLALIEMVEQGRREPLAITFNVNATERRSLAECVASNEQVSFAIRRANWNRLRELRGAGFQRFLHCYTLMSKAHVHFDSANLRNGRPFNMAVVHVGSPACGMNSAVRTFVRMGLFYGCRIYAVSDSFHGLAQGKFELMTWQSVNDWSGQGGSHLGSHKCLPSFNYAAVASQLGAHQIDALLLVGGFEAFHGCLQLAEMRGAFREFCIPMAVLPCSISNNVPGSDLSIGCDSALNVLCKLIDTLKQSAQGARRSVFIVETMGGFCGCLATLSALASGADNAYIKEESYNVDDIKNEVVAIGKKMVDGVERYIVTRCERANEHYTSEFMRRLFNEEGGGEYSVKVNVFGHAQQGGQPSPFDRLISIRMSAYVTQVLLDLASNAWSAPDGRTYTTSPDSALLLGMGGDRFHLTPVEELKRRCNFQLRLPSEQWWLKLRPLLRLLAAHKVDYSTSA